MTPLLAALAASTALVLATPAAAQDMPGMPGMKMPAPAKPAARKLAAKKPAAKPAAKNPAAKKKAVRKPAARRSPTRPAAPAQADAMPGMDHGSMPAMDHGAMPGMDHGAMPGMAMPPAKPDAAATPDMPGMDMSGSQQGHDMTTMPGMTMPGMAQTGTALPAGNAPAPAAPLDHYADRTFPADEMGRARSAMMQEDGGQVMSQVLFNIAELQANAGGEGYRWDGEAWVGGDINRLWLKSEGEGTFRDGVDNAEVQALYSRAVGPYFNLQAGVRQDFQPSPSRTYATVGFEGLAPYMFEVEGALFLSDRGDLLGRLEGYYDERITQRLILQPRVELNFAAQDVPENRLGAGLTDAELGLRLRYEVSRQFAPYVGVSYEATTGRTADFARADGKDPTTTAFVAGVRFGF
jgi:copper resistance protein B